MQKIVKIYYTLDDVDLKQIKKQMIEKDLNFSKLADNLGVSRAYISSIINGKRTVTKRVLEMFESQGIKLKEENGYIIFADGYDGSGNEIHRQEFVKYKDKFKALETLMIMKEQLTENESKRKSLEEKVKWLSEENEECSIDGQKYNELREQKDKEIEKLKQTQKQLAISELEKLKENSWQSATDISCLLDYTELAKIIDSQIKELKEMK